MKRSKIVHGHRLVTFATALAALLSGCAWGDFTPYSGQQQTWPTQPGSFVATQYAIPAYIHSYPDRPYNVIGYLDATTAPIRRRGVVAFGSRHAKFKHAKAKGSVILNRDEGDDAHHYEERQVRNAVRAAQQAKEENGREG